MKKPKKHVVIGVCLMIIGLLAPIMLWDFLGYNKPSITQGYFCPTDVADRQCFKPVYEGVDNPRDCKRFGGTYEEIFGGIGVLMKHCFVQ